MKKYLAIAKQAAKEKMGKAEKSVNSDETNDARDSFVVLKKGYTKVITDFKTLCTEGWSLMLAQSEIFAECMLKFSTSLQSSILNDMFPLIQKVGMAFKSVDSISTQCMESTKEDFLVPINNLLETEIKTTNELRTQQESARLQLENAIGQLKSLQKKSTEQKLKGVEEEVAATQMEYDRKTDAFRDAMDRLGISTRTDMVDALSKLVDANIQCLEESLAVWKDVQVFLKKSRPKHGHSQKEMGEEEEDDLYDNYIGNDNQNYSYNNYTESSTSSSTSTTPANVGDPPKTPTMEAPSGLLSQLSNFPTQNRKSSSPSPSSSPSRSFPFSIIRSSSLTSLPTSAFHSLSGPRSSSPVPPSVSSPLAAPPLIITDDIPQQGVGVKESNLVSPNQEGTKLLEEDEFDELTL